MKPIGEMTYHERLNYQIGMLVQCFEIGEPTPAERDLVFMMGYSRATVRECLTVLAYLGYVQKRWGARSVYVRNWSEQQTRPSVIWSGGMITGEKT